MRIAGGRGRSYLRAPGALGPIWAGTLGGLLAMWATFVPSFLWIFAGGPYVEALIGNKALVTGAFLALFGPVLVHATARSMRTRQLGDWREGVEQHREDEPS